MVGCLQYVLVNKNFLFKFEDGQKRDMSYVSLLCLYLEEEVYLDMDDPISHLPQK